MHLRRLETVDSVVEKLGGNQPTGEIAGANPKTVSMWKTLNAFPPKTFLAMTTALAERGFDAPSSLWGMTGAVPEQERAAS